MRSVPLSVAAEQPVRVLVVDDEPAVRRMLRTSLSARGYQVTEASSGPEAIEWITTSRPELVLLDLGLPGMSGIEVTRVLREWFSSPIIVLSVQDQERDKVAALDAGADDFLTKPFGLSELLARMRAALRRVHHAVEQPVVTSGELVIDMAARQVRLAGKPVALTPTEYDILRVLARHAGKVLTHKQLMTEVWGHLQQDLHTLRVNVSNLRKKVEQEPSHPQIVVTEPGVGYRFT